MFRTPLAGHNKNMTQTADIKWTLTSKGVEMHSRSYDRLDRWVAEFDTYSLVLTKRYRPGQRWNYDDAWTVGVYPHDDETPCQWTSSRTRAGVLARLDAGSFDI